MMEQGRGPLPASPHVRSADVFRLAEFAGRYSFGNMNKNQSRPWLEEQISEQFLRDNMDLGRKPTDAERDCGKSTVAISCGGAFILAAARTEWIDITLGHSSQRAF